MDISVAAAPHLRRAGLLVSIASLIVIAFATLLPQSPGAVESHFCVICGSFGSVDAILNVVLFVPLGIGLALYGLRGRNSVVAICVLSAAIETTQFLLIPGRDSTLGDVITNTLGGAIGFMIARYATAWLRPLPRTANRLAAAFAALWLTVQAISSFGFRVSLPSSQYYGQIARALGHFAVFSGVVLGTQIGDARITNTRLENSALVREELLHGAEVATTVVPAATPNGIAPIVRVVDSHGREIALIAQQGRDYLFGIRTGAAALRLRQPYFALSRVFRGAASRDPAMDDTLALSADYDSQNASLSAQREHARYGRRILVTSSLGWVMLMPFEWAIEGTPTEAAISMLWIAFLLLPAAYWASTAATSSRSPARRSIFVFAALSFLVLFAGLVGIPHIFAIRAAPVRDWVAALTAIAVGVCLALMLSGGPSRVPSIGPPRRGLE
jgi:VanZ family protein